MKIGINDTELHTWFERDRAHIELRNSQDDQTIVQWWDDDVYQAFEDGFLDSKVFIFGKLRNPNGLHSSVFAYAESHGLLPEAAENEMVCPETNGFSMINFTLSPEKGVDRGRRPNPK